MKSFLTYDTNTVLPEQIQIQWRRICKSSSLILGQDSNWTFSTRNADGRYWSLLECFSPHTIPRPLSWIISGAVHGNFNPGRKLHPRWNPRDVPVAMQLKILTSTYPDHTFTIIHFTNHCFQNFYRPQAKFAKVMFLQVSVCPQGGGCMVAGGACMVVEGCAWWGACMVAGVCAWLWGGMCGCRGVCMVAGGVCGYGGHAWLQGACVVAGGVHGCGGHAWLQGEACMVGGAYVVAGGVHGIR